MNPFCLPTDTGRRFILLIVTVLASSLFIYDALSLHKLNVQAYRNCLAFEPSAVELSSNMAGPLELKDPSVLVAKSEAFSRCVRAAQQTSAEWMVGGLLALAMVTFLIVWFLPVIEEPEVRCRLAMLLPYVV